MQQKSHRLSKLFTIRKEFTLPMAWMMEIMVEDCPNITLHRGKVFDLGIPNVKFSPYVSWLGRWRSGPTQLEMKSRNSIVWILSCICRSSLKQKSHRQSKRSSRKGKSSLRRWLGWGKCRPPNLRSSLNSKGGGWEVYRHGDSFRRLRNQIEFACGQIGGTKA